MPDGVEFDVKWKVDEIEARMKKIEDSIRQTADNTDKHTSRMEKNFRKVGSEAVSLENSIKRIGDAVIAYLSINTVLELGRGIIAVRSEFEKYTSVLTTAYGDQEKAIRAMEMLKQTAKETPFQLTELAQAFVLLKNRGVDPSKESLIKAGDFASSTGRTFQELSEALLNIGELEVWKKFGVNASLQGDKIKLSFRGLTMEVDKSTAGVLKAVEAFGSMKGISGSMQGQMETLGGKVSNLKDSWDQLQNTLGKSEGWKNSITWLTQLTDKANEFFKGSRDRSADAATSYISQFFDTLKSKKPEEVLKSVNEKIGNLQKSAAMVEKTLRQEVKSQNWLFPDAQKAADIKFNRELLTTYNNELTKLKGIADQPWPEFLKWYDKLFKPEPAPKPPVLGILEEIEANLKRLAEARKKATTIEEIVRIDEETEKYTKQDAAVKGLIQRKKDLAYMAKAPDDLLGKVNSPLLNQTLGTFQKNKYTGQYDLTTQPTTPTMPQLDSYKAYDYQLQQILKIIRNTDNAAVEEHKRMLDQVDNMNTTALNDELEFWQQSLQHSNLTDKQKEEALKSIDKLTKVINEKSVQNVRDFTDAFKEIGNFIGGSIGNDLNKLATGFESVAAGYKSFTAPGSDLAQQVLGSVNIMIGSVNTMMTLGNLTTKFLDSISGWADAEKARRDELEKERVILQEMTYELNRQLELTNEIKGEDKLTNYTKLINQAIAGEKASLEALTKYLPYIGDIYGGRSRTSTAAWTIEQWRQYAKNATNAATKSQLDEFIANYDEFAKQLRDIINMQNAELTGTTYDSILTAIQDAFADGTMSAEEFANNFDTLMRKSIMNAFSRQYLEKQLEGWYDQFAAFSQSGGQLTEAEIGKLRQSLQDITNTAQTGLEGLIKASGIDFTSSASSNGSALSGAFKTMSQESADLMAGQLNANRIIALEQKEIAQEGYHQLVLIEQNTRPIGEIRDLLKANANNSLINERANGR